MRITLLMILLMAGFSVWYLRMPEPQWGPDAGSASPAPPGDSGVHDDDRTDGVLTEVEETTAGPEGETEPEPEPVVLDLTLPADFFDDSELHLVETEEQLTLPNYFGEDETPSPRRLNGRLMLQETEEGKTVIDGVEINIQRALPLR